MFCPIGRGYFRVAFLYPVSRVIARQPQGVADLLPMPFNYPIVEHRWPALKVRVTAIAVRKGIEWVEPNAPTPSPYPVATVEAHALVRGCLS